jgi:hypothetical protein
MDLLKAVNAILPRLGEYPVTSLDAPHPTVAIILPAIESNVDSVLMRGWWFNEMKYTVHLSTDGTAKVPVGTLEFLPDQEGPVVRGRSFFNTADNSFVFPAPFTGRLKQRVDFEDLPESIAYLVLYKALVEVYITDIGLEQVVREWQSAVMEYESLASAEHLRNRRHSTKKSARYARIRNAMRG